MFFNCAHFDNLTMRFKTAQLHSLFLFYQLSLPVFIAVSILGIVTNLFFLALIIRGLAKLVLPRKRFWLVLSRAVSDLLTSICTLLWSFLDYAGVSLPHKDPIMNVLQLVEVSMGFWVVTGSYACLAAVSFIAAKHPLYFRTQVRSKWCQVAISLVWCWALAYTAALTPFGGGAFFSHLSGPCKGDCQQVLLVVTASLFLFFYVFVPGSYLVLLFSLNRSQNCHNPARSSFWRLGLNVLLYTLFGSPIPLMTAIAILLLKLVSQARQDHCYSTSMEAMHDQKTILVGRVMAHLIWNARTVLDPLVSFLSDRQLRRLAKGAEMQPCSEYPNARRRSRIGTSTFSEEHRHLQRRRRSGSESCLYGEARVQKPEVRCMSSTSKPILHQGSLDTTFVTSSDGGTVSGSRDIKMAVFSIKCNRSLEH